MHLTSLHARPRKTLPHRLPIMMASVIIVLPLSSVLFFRQQRQNGEGRGRVGH
jgi:hypothetical protein